MIDGKRLDELGEERESREHAPHSDAAHEAWATAAFRAEADAVRNAPEGNRNDQLNRSAFALGQIVGSGHLDEATVRHELMAAAKAAGLDRAEASTTLESGLVAGRESPRWPSREPSSRNPSDFDSDARGYKETDLGNAERLVDRHGHDLRYCPQRRRWLEFDGQRYVWDHDGAILRRCKRTVRSIYSEASKLDGDARKQRFKHAVRSERRERLAAMAHLARSEPGIPVRVEQLDADPYLLNAPNGTIDLRDGTLRRHERTDLLTKMVAADFVPDATDPLWDDFVSKVTGGDEDVARYLQRICGYALVGESPEKAFFCFHGEKDTGKSTLLNGLSRVLADYAVAADSDTWLRRSQVGGNRGDLVRLRGARLVTSSEFRENARFDEALLKRITGGDEITAAAKYEGEICFGATFTLIIAANDLPIIRDDDHALWRRFRPVPFRHVPQQMDPSFLEKLLAPEVARAILAWAVRGCLHWQKDGLRPAAAALASAQAYRHEMDRFAGFAERYLEFGVDGRITRSAVRRRYHAWCHEEGVQPLSAKQLATRMRMRGATDGKSSGVTVWKNVEWAPGFSKGHEG